jgi:hypothetical protein
MGIRRWISGVIRPDEVETEKVTTDQLKIPGYRTVKVDGNSPVSVSNLDATGVTYTVDGTGYDAYGIILRNGDGNGSGNTSVAMRLNGDSNNNYFYYQQDGTRTTSATEFNLIFAGGGASQFRWRGVVIPGVGTRNNTMIECVAATCSGGGGSNYLDNGSAASSTDVTQFTLFANDGGSGESFELVVLNLEELA